MCSAGYVPPPGFKSKLPHSECQGQRTSIGMQVFCGLVCSLSGGPLEACRDPAGFLAPEVPAASTQTWGRSLPFPLQAVITCVKNKEFERASRILRRHMSKDPSNQVRLESGWGGEELGL